MSTVDFRLEVVIVPVADVDRAKAFYADQIGFNVDHDTEAEPGNASRPAHPARLDLLGRHRDRIAGRWSPARSRGSSSSWMTWTPRTSC